MSHCHNMSHKLKENKSFTRPDDDLWVQIIIWRKGKQVIILSTIVIILEVITRPGRGVNKVKPKGWFKYSF